MTVPRSLRGRSRHKRWATKKRKEKDMKKKKKEERAGWKRHVWSSKTNTRATGQQVVRAQRAQHYFLAPCLSFFPSAVALPGNKAHARCKRRRQMQRRAGRQKSDEKKRPWDGTKTKTKQEQWNEPLPSMGNCGCKSTLLLASIAPQLSQEETARASISSSRFRSHGYPTAGAERQRLRPLFVSLSSPLRTQILQDPGAHRENAGHLMPKHNRRRRLSLRSRFPHGPGSRRRRSVSFVSTRVSFFSSSLWHCFFLFVCFSLFLYTSAEFYFAEASMPCALRRYGERSRALCCLFTALSDALRQISECRLRLSFFLSLVPSFISHFFLSTCLLLLARPTLCLSLLALSIARPAL